MRSRAVNTTKEQDEVRAKILRKRNPVSKSNNKKIAKTIDEIIGVPVDPIEKKLWYMGNCIFWIRKYNNGETDLVRCMTSIECLKKLCDELKTVILKS